MADTADRTFKVGALVCCVWSKSEADVVRTVTGANGIDIDRVYYIDPPATTLRDVCIPGVAVPYAGPFARMWIRPLTFAQVVEYVAGLEDRDEADRLFRAATVARLTEG